MAFIIKFKDGRKEIWHRAAFEELSPDLRGMLRVQLEELINEIEDREDQATSIASVHAIQYLDDCYLAA